MTTTYFNGEFLPKDQVRIAPDDRGFLFGDGVYEVVRSYGGKIFALDAHMNRMRYGLAELSIHGVDAGKLGAAAIELLDRNGLKSADATVYMQVTRGAAPRLHAFPDPAVAPTVYMTASKLVPKNERAAGVATITVPDIRWARCDIKTVQLLPNCMASQRAKEAGVREALMVRDGVVLEGSHTSVFFVIDGEVRTAPKNNYVLPSITREVLLDICKSAGIPARETPVFTHELARASEVFLAGTTVEATGVVKVDSMVVGKGVPGPVTMRLSELFSEQTK